MTMNHFGGSAHSGREHSTRSIAELSLDTLGQWFSVPAPYHEHLVILGPQHLEGFPEDSKGCRVQNEFLGRQCQPCHHPVVQVGQILPASILELKKA